MLVDWKLERRKIQLTRCRRYGTLYVMVLWFLRAFIEEFCQCCTTWFPFAYAKRVVVHLELWQTHKIDIFTCHRFGHLRLQRSSLNGTFCAEWHTKNHGFTALLLTYSHSIVVMLYCRRWKLFIQVSNAFPLFKIDNTTTFTLSQNLSILVFCSVAVLYIRRWERYWSNFMWQTKDGSAYSVRYT